MLSKKEARAMLGLLSFFKSNIHNVQSAGLCDKTGHRISAIFRAN
jgi:hypothetical protein